MERVELLDGLRKRFSRVISKRGAVLLGLWGEAGCGKSWLAEHLLAELPCRHATIRATVSLAELSLQFPRAEGLPSWAEQLLVRLSRGASADPPAVANVLGTLLTTLSPFVLYVEDLHEASQRSLDLWQAVATMLKHSRGVGLLVASRTFPNSVLESIKVEALSQRETVQMLEAAVRTALPSEAPAWIFERAQGNPLYTLEYFRFLTKGGFLWSDGERWHWRRPVDEVMPTSIEALVAQLLHTAAPTMEAWSALEAKALLPVGTSDEMWAFVARLELRVLHGVKARLSDHGLLAEGEFAHLLFREVARQELTQERRRELAQRAVVLLEGSNPELAADLVEQAGLDAAYTCQTLTRAAEAAFLANRRGQAAHFLARAADYASGWEQVDTALRAAKLLRHTNLPEAARLTALALKVDPGRMEAVFLRARLLAAPGLKEEAEQLLSELPPDEQLQPQWLHAFVEVRVSGHNYAGALALWHDYPKHQASAPPDTRAHIGRALIQLGRFAEAKVFLEDAMRGPGVGRLDQAQLWSTYGLVPLIQGNFGAAVERYDRALAILTECSKESSEVEHNLIQTKRSEALWMRSLALYRWGRFHEAISDLESYLELAARQGNGRAHAEGQVNLGTYLIEVGEFERAEETLLESRAFLERSQNIRWLAVVEQQLVQLYLDWAPPYGSALALKHAQAAELYARRSQSPPHLAEALCFISRAEAVHGQPRRALQLVEELQRLASELRESRLVAYGAWVRGLALEKLGQEVAALQSLEEAVSQVASLGHGPFAHRLALEIDRIQGDASAAADRLQHFKRIHGINWVHIAHRYFPQLASVQRGPEATPALRLEVLGQLRIVKKGVPHPYAARQGRLLLALLLDARLAGRSSVSQLDLLDALYPDLDENRSSSALKQLVYRLRSAFGSAVVTRTNDGYALGAVSSDAEDFLQSGDTRLWRGPYLEDLDEGWASTAREAIHHAACQRARESAFPTFSATA